MRRNVVFLVLISILCTLVGLSCSQHPSEESQAQTGFTIIEPPPLQLPNVVPSNPLVKPAEQEVVPLPPRPVDTFVEEVFPVILPEWSNAEASGQTPIPTATPEAATEEEDVEDDEEWEEDDADDADDDDEWEEDDADDADDDDEWEEEDLEISEPDQSAPLDDQIFRKFVHRARYQPAALLKKMLDAVYGNPPEGEESYYEEEVEEPDLRPKFVAYTAINPETYEADVSLISDLNALIVIATRAQYAEIKSLLNKLDRPPLQVYLDMWIGEVNLQDNETLGSQLAAMFQGQVNAGGTNLPYEGTGTTSFTDVGTTTDGLSYIIGSQGNFSLLFKMLATENRLRVLSDPHLFVRHNKTARVEVGERVPIKETREDEDGNITTEIRTEEVNLVLNVTPQINYDGTILIKLEQVIDEIGEKDYANTGAPLIRTRKVSTELLLRDGVTVLIGGLISLRDERVTNGVPLLKDIPLVGRLFRNTEYTIVDRELILLITPHVMWTSDQEMVYTGVMNDYMRKWKDEEYFVKPDSQRVREYLNIMPSVEEKGQ